MPQQERCLFIILGQNNSDKFFSDLKHFFFSPSPCLYHFPHFYTVDVGEFVLMPKQAMVHV